MRGKNTVGAMFSVEGARNATRSHRTCPASSRRADVRREREEPATLRGGRIGAKAEIAPSALNGPATKADPAELAEHVAARERPVAEQLEERGAGIGAGWRSCAIFVA